MLTLHVDAFCGVSAWRNERRSDFPAGRRASAGKYSVASAGALLPSGTDGCGNGERMQKRKSPPACTGGLLYITSLTITYFHTGCSTIIGAKSFHGPVRDGKGWDRLAMVIRHDLYEQPRQFAPALNLEEVLLGCSFVSSSCTRPWTTKVIGTSRTGN